MIICEICKKRVCLPACPRFQAPDVEEYCVLCGDPIGQKKGVYRLNGFPYCEECLDFADAETLLRICEMPKRKWLEQMGFTYGDGPDMSAAEAI